MTDNKKNRKLYAIPAVLFLTWLAGLIWFYAALPQPADHAIQQIKPVDGIIVLTGGPTRIYRGLDLLAEGRGKRMLISGVNGDISNETLRSALLAKAGTDPQSQERFSRWFDCCVDLGRNAMDTVGNAREGADWAIRRGYQSLYIVTSYPHMPRSLLEMRRAMPTLTLLPFPVKQRDDAGRSLLAEYHKYLLSLLSFTRIHPASNLPLENNHQP